MFISRLRHNKKYGNTDPLSSVILALSSARSCTVSYLTSPYNVLRPINRWPRGLFYCKDGDELIMLYLFWNIKVL